MSDPIALLDDVVACFSAFKRKCYFAESRMDGSRTVVDPFDAFVMHPHQDASPV